MRGNAITGKSAGISIFKCRPDFTVDGNDIHHTVFSGRERRKYRKYVNIVCQELKYDRELTL